MYGDRLIPDSLSSPKKKKGKQPRQHVTPARSGRVTGRTRFFIGLTRSNLETLFSLKSRRQLVMLETRALN
jgi:hypothetical protein